jgi:branched-chain amino acid transport system permease protein
MKHLWSYLFVGILLTVPLWLHDQYFLHILITTGIFIVGAMSLNLLLGFTGQLSLGHIAFFGIGAYTSALVSLGFDIPTFGDMRIVHEPWHPVAGILIGTAVAGLCGYVVGKLSFKIRGAYFVIVTISFAEVVRLVALNWVDLTQGPLALNNIPPVGFNLPVVGEMIFWQKVPNYYLVLALAILAYVLIQRIVRSRMGRAMIALRENEPLATSLGIDVTRYLVFAAVVAAAMAGAAGGLYAHYIRIIDPDIFLFIYTVTMVIMVVTGGKGTLAGPVVGGIIFGVLPVGLRAVAAPEAQWIVYGVVMVLIVFFLPRGIVPAVCGWWHRKTGSKPVHIRPAKSAAPARGQESTHGREVKLASAELATRGEVR